MRSRRCSTKLAAINIMSTRKDLIFRKTKKTSNIKKTDIENIYTREHDFKDHDVIFDFNNEYRNTLTSPQILHDFKNKERWLKMEVSKHKTIIPKIVRNDKRQMIVNVGFDKKCLDFLYCDEKLDDISSEEDPYAQSDDSKDKDYLPENDLNSTQSDHRTSDCDTVTEISENNVVSMHEELFPENPSPQHCEFDNCKLSAFSCCDQCLCLLCTVHYDEISVNRCQNHCPYSTEKYQNKENDNLLVYQKDENNYNHLQQNINKDKNNISKLLTEKHNNDNINLSSKEDKRNVENEHKCFCEYDKCQKEIFSACWKCQCFLCYSHFINEDTYNDCKSHNSSLLPEKNTTNKKYRTKIHKQIKGIENKFKESNNLKIIEVISQQEKKSAETEEREKRESENNNITEREKPISKSQNTIKCTRKSTEKRRNSFDFIQTTNTLLLSPTPRKRRNTIQTLTTDEEILTQSLQTEMPPKKRKKYNTSLLQRKIEKKEKYKLEHSVKPACGEKCVKKCTSKLSQEDREVINSKYWDLSWQEQHSFIRAHTSIAVPKRKTTTEPKRKPKRVFTLKTVNNTRVEVCQTFLLTTLGYKKTNDRILHNEFTEKSSDKRGKHQKTPQFDRNLLTQHIESFNPLSHHYRREHAPLRRYLPSDLNIAHMHKHFCEQNPEQIVSYELYRQHLKKMNISFTHLGNEECEECEAYGLHTKDTSHDATNQMVVDCSVCIEWARHHEQYKKARELYKKHAKMEQNNDEKYYSADLEKVIMLPRLDMFKSAIFCPRLVVYNETFAPLGKITLDSKPVTVLWHDAIAGRKQNDIMSAFYHFLYRNRDVTKLHLWLDNCGGQNKNWLLYSLFVYLINSEVIATEQIILYYFEPGHTFMSCDQVHHQIELAMKKKNKLYDFTDFEDTVASINKAKVAVKSMATEDFFDVPNYVSDRRVQNSNPRAYLKNMSQVCFTRKSFDLKYKNDFDDTEYTELRFLSDKYLKNPDIMKLEFHLQPKGIDSKRKAEIIKTLSNVIPKHKLKFWENLPTKNLNENEKEKSGRNTNKKRHFKD